MAIRPGHSGRGSRGACGGPRRRDGSGAKHDGKYGNRGTVNQPTKKK